MLFQLCKQSLFFWPIGIEVETETRLRRGKSQAIKEIIDLNLAGSFYLCESSQWSQAPSPTTHPWSLSMLPASAEPRAQKPSSALLPLWDQITLVIF